MSAPQIRLDDAFRNRLANFLIATRRHLIDIRDTYATTVAASASPGRPNTPATTPIGTAGT